MHHLLNIKTAGIRAVSHYQGFQSKTIIQGHISIAVFNSYAKFTHLNNQSKEYAYLPCCPNGALNLAQTQSTPPKSLAGIETRQEWGVGRWRVDAEKLSRTTKTCGL